MTQEHKINGLRLFYDEGTPHIWKMDDNERVERWRFYSDELHYGMDAVKYANTDYYEITYYTICKNGNHRTNKDYRMMTLEQIADLILSNVGLHFTEAHKELKNRLNNA